MVKSAVDEFKSIFELLRNNQNQLQADLDRARQELETQRKKHLKPLLLDWLTLRDQLVAAIDNLSQLHHKQSHLLPKGIAALFNRGHRRQREIVLDGQRMSLRKLDECLANYEVQPIRTVGLPLNPHTMRASAVENNPALENGIVTAELRAGFTWEGNLLRVAEVNVNKTT